jgi:hypothetical protein
MGSSRKYEEKECRIKLVSALTHFVFSSLREPLLCHGGVNNFGILVWRSDPRRHELEVG